MVKPDAPWESIESEEETERNGWREYYESVKDLPNDVRRWKFEIEWNGRHIGWISSYPIEENFKWLGEIKDGQTIYRAICIDICEPDVWGTGIGTNLRTVGTSFIHKLGQAMSVCSLRQKY